MDGHREWLAAESLLGLSAGVSTHDLQQGRLILKGNITKDKQDMKLLMTQTWKLQGITPAPCCWLYYSLRPAHIQEDGNQALSFDIRSSICVQKRKKPVGAIIADCHRCLRLTEFLKDQIRTATSQSYVVLKLIRKSFWNNCKLNDEKKYLGCTQLFQKTQFQTNSIHGNNQTTEWSLWLIKFQMSKF